MFYSKGSKKQLTEVEMLQREATVDSATTQNFLFFSVLLSFKFLKFLGVGNIVSILAGGLLDYICHALKYSRFGVPNCLPYMFGLASAH
jgi:hypothetical protein